RLGSPRLFAAERLHWVHGRSLSRRDIARGRGRRGDQRPATAYVSGSSGVTPNSTAVIQRDRHPANTSPITQPAQLRISPLRTNNHLSALGSAPSAIRIPTSRRRCPTA